MVNVAFDKCVRAVGDRFDPSRYDNEEGVRRAIAAWLRQQVLWAARDRLRKPSVQYSDPTKLDEKCPDESVHDDPRVLPWRAYLAAGRGKAASAAAIDYLLAQYTYGTPLPPAVVDELCAKHGLTFPGIRKRASRLRPTVKNEFDDWERRWKADRCFRDHWLDRMDQSMGYVAEAALLAECRQYHDDFLRQRESCIPSNAALIDTVNDLHEPQDDGLEIVYEGKLFSLISSGGEMIMDAGRQGGPAAGPPA